MKWLLIAAICTKRPEEGWTEFETTYYIVDQLRKMGIPVTVGKANINEKEVLGRDPQLVEDAITRAVNHGVPQAFIDECADIRERLQ